MPPTDRSDDPIALAAGQWDRHGWSAATPGMTMITSVMRVQQILQQRVDAVLKPFDLSFARYEVLMLLSFSSAGAMPMKRVGSRLQVHPTSVTSAVDRLEAQGFVERVPHPTDRRTVLATITDKGREVASAATDALNAEVFEQPGLPVRDLRTLNDLLGRLRSQAGDF
jgi:DNA-binding MarR family transcriptional regulator